MDLTALIFSLVATGISVIATVVSIVSVKYSRDQARAAQDRLHMDRRPRIGHAYVPRMGGGHLLQLSNDGPGDLDRVEVELLNPAQPYESGPQAISDDDALGRHGVSTTVSFGPWRLGETRRLLLWHNGPIRGVINLRCTCYLGGSEPWQVLVDAQPPPDA